MKYELNLIEQYKKSETKGFKTLGLSDKDIAKGTSISVEQVQNILKT